MASSTKSSPERSRSPEAAAKSPAAPKPSASPANGSGPEEGEVDSAQASPSQTVPSDAPPLPDEPVPQAEDDGWDCQWDAGTQAWFFHNRFTGKTQWENPRAPATTSTTPSEAPLPKQDIIEGYNPAIHGDYDPNAWYAQKYQPVDETAAAAAPFETPGAQGDAYASAAGFNRFTGQFQQPDMGPSRHTDEAKSSRQLNAYFDVDAVARTDDGRSLKAERANKRISKSEVKAFKEKRKARKEEKRRAWLRE